MKNEIYIYIFFSIPFLFSRERNISVRRANGKTQERIVFDKITMATWKSFQV